MHGGLEVRPSQGLEVWRVDVASRARNGAIVCRHKGLEVCGRGDVEAKGFCCETDACRSPEEAVYCVQEGAAATDGQLFGPAAAVFCVEARVGRRLVRARWDACAGVCRRGEGVRGSTG